MARGKNSLHPLYYLLLVVIALQLVAAARYFLMGDLVGAGIYSITFIVFAIAWKSGLIKGA